MYTIMDKIEYVTSFIEMLRNGDNDKIYKFFTPRSVIFDTNELKEWSLDEFISYLKDNLFGKEIKIGRIFESAVAVKIEIESDSFNYEALIIEIKERRIKRLELFKSN